MPQEAKIRKNRYRSSLRNTDIGKIFDSSRRLSQYPAVNQSFGVLSSARQTICFESAFHCRVNDRCDEAG